MQEKTGNCVVINGGFVVIDHTSKKEDERGIATVINVWSKYEKITHQEIHTILELFAWSGGGGLKAGKTIFSFHDIWTINPANDKPLKNHKDPTKIIIVKNQDTDEFFVVMDEDVSLAKANDFIREIDRKNHPLLDNRMLQFPRPHLLGTLGLDGNPTFKIVMNSRLAVIKLELV